MVERRGRSSQQLYEEYAYVLDFLPYGKPGARPGYRTNPVVQLVGESYFTLLEANVRKGVTLSVHNRVYVGKNVRKEITYILGRIGYDELTANAKAELTNVIERIVLNNEERFVEFFNTARAITPRMHALELIPGIGKQGGDLEKSVRYGCTSGKNIIINVSRSVIYAEGDFPQCVRDAADYLRRNINLFRPF